MPRKSTKRSNKGKRTRKQKPIVMVGCSKKGKKSCRNNNVFSTLANKSCPNCGPNCHCGSNCKCPHPCPGTCYLNRRMKKQKGGQGCGSCGCPIAPLSWKQMNQFGGAYPPNLIPQVNGKPVIIAPPSKGYQPILGIGQNGGNCDVCNSIQVASQSGGNNVLKPLPGPFEGSAWGPNLKWPGMNGIGGDENYFKPYNTNYGSTSYQLPADADAGYLNPMSLVGGYRYNKSHSKTSSRATSNSISSKRGGGLVPQDLVNLGRDFNYNLKTAYNAFNGYKAPVDPSPYKGQLTGTLSNNRF